MRKFLFFIGFCIILLLGVIWNFSPIYKVFPKPGGLYSVGTTVLELDDTSRPELFSDNKSDIRRLVVRAFYPAQCVQYVEKYSYLGEKMPYYQKFIQMHYNVPDFIAKLFLRGMNTHSYINASLASSQGIYPVVLFSHGLLGMPSDTYITVLENLASHGFIVFAIDHSYLNGLTLYLDGSAVSSLKLSEEFNNMSIKEQQAFQSAAIDIYKEDMKFVIDQLEKINENPNNMFYKRLNLEKIAVMGHSAGGTAAIEFCRNDHRCKTAIDLDGWYDHVIGQEPIHKPLLLIFGSKSLEISEPTPEYLDRKELTRKQYFEREKNIDEHRKRLCSASNCSFVVIPDATHGDFGDEMFIKWPLRAWCAVNPFNTIDTINRSIVEFLNAYFYVDQN